MDDKTYWIKYFSPVIGMLFCPVTILFLWTIWSGPVVNSDTDIIEEVKP
tara:strand:- start:166 stop:312 length:147 start_codon:yes stop_codon:yes gene_type:complete